MFTRGILSPSLPRFHGNRYTASPLEVKALKLGAWSGVGPCAKIKTAKISAGGSTGESAKISRYTVRTHPHCRDL